jgi:hypothetical protein
MITSRWPFGSATVKSAGTSKRSGAGSPRVMFVSRYVVSPNRGSECRLITSTFRSGDVHRSDTILIGSSLPICPAGIVTVVRVPSTSTPSMNCFPSDSGTGGAGAAVPVTAAREVQIIWPLVMPAAPIGGMAMCASGGRAISNV